jgi:hypothetical protein
MTLYSLAPSVLSKPAQRNARIPERSGRSSLTYAPLRLRLLSGLASAKHVAVGELPSLTMPSRYQDCGCHNGRPDPALADARLGDVARPDYLVTQLPLVEPFVVTLVNVELHAKDRR